MTPIQVDQLEVLEALRTSILEAQCNLTRHQISDIQRQIHRVTAALNCARNTHAAVNKLPSELLELIFAFVQPSYEDFAPAWPSYKSLEWTSVARVCTRWRSIALSLPTLWSMIDLCHNDDSEVGEAFLARSGAEPLTVFFSTEDISLSPCDVQILQAILDHHVSRIHSLHIAVDVDDDLENLCARLHCEPQNLQNLTIFVRAFSWKHSPIIFGGRAPSIRRLIVRECAVWEHNAFADLTHLVICDRVDLDEFTQQPLLDFLSSTPQLEVMIISACAALVSDAVSRRIFLPLLRKLQLEGDSAGDWPLLHVLEIPDTCDVRLLFIYERNLGEGRLVSLLPPSTRFRPLQRDIHHLHVSGQRCASYRSFLMHSGRVFIDGIPDFTFLIRLADPDASLTVNMDDLPSTMPITKWTQFLSSVPRIHSLHITGGSGSVRSAILDALATTSETGPDTMLCPALETLYVHGYTPEDLLRIWTVVSCRALSGVALKEIHLQEDISRHEYYNLWAQGTRGKERIISLNSAGTLINVLTKYTSSSSKDFGREVWESWGPFEEGATRAREWATIERRPPTVVETDTASEDETDSDE
ncbi:hypothetical protein EV121DRAFT_295801 [Schizophyllum commune]